MCLILKNKQQQQKNKIKSLESINNFVATTNTHIRHKELKKQTSEIK
jgi:hypothetical protein